MIFDDQHVIQFLVITLTHIKHIRIVITGILQCWVVKVVVNLFILKRETLFLVA